MSYLNFKVTEMLCDTIRMLSNLIRMLKIYGWIKGMNCLDWNNTIMLKDTTRTQSKWIQIIK